mgnify:FL=1
MPANDAKCPEPGTTDITSSDDCEKALSLLNLQSLEHKVIYSTSQEYPKGCSWNKNESTSFFNQNKAQAGRSASLAPICWVGTKHHKETVGDDVKRCYECPAGTFGGTAISTKRVFNRWTGDYRSCKSFHFILNNLIFQKSPNQC